MELHFIWINPEHGGYLKNVGINLSARFIFELNTPSANHQVEITIKPNPDFIPDLFGKPNVTNVTAVIGKNGSGKSSILRYIKSHFPEGLQAEVFGDIVAYSRERDGAIQYHLLYPANLRVFILDETELFEIKSYDDFAGMDTFSNSSKTGGADYIYYSYFLDYPIGRTDWSGLKDISTSALLLAGRQRIFEEVTDDADRQYLLSSSSDMDRFVGNEIAMALQFLISDYRKLIPFNPPKKLFVKIDLSDRLFFKKDGPDSDIYNLLDHFNYIMPDYSKNNSPSIDDVINNLCVAILVNLFIDERKFGSVRISGLPGFKIATLRTPKEIILDFFHELEKIDNFRIEKYKRLAFLVPRFIDFIRDMFESNRLVIAGGAQFTIDVDEGAESMFHELMNFYLQIKGISTFLSFGWRELSNGEQSYLSFMSRFYHLKHHEIGDLKKNLIILIDEGDAGYHPEWQRNFFKTTLDFLSTVFHNHTIQLIFTANTPFLSSDLTKPHILFIEKISNSKSSIYGKENDRAYTFGGNIHTLFANAYFMNNVLIGEFAKEKINKIIEYLNDEGETEKINSYKMLIDQIGEPILRNKLQEMWAEKFGLEDELELLLKKTDELKARLKAKKTNKKKS